MVGERGVTYNKNNPQGFNQEASKELKVTENAVTNMKKDALTKTDQSTTVTTDKEKNNDTFFTG